MNIHEMYMRMAVQEAEKAKQNGEVPIGAIVVSHNRVIAKGHNQVEKLTDATAHAEMIAITSAANALGSKYLTDCAIYVTIEPCLMCATALYWSKIGAIYIGAGDNRYGYSYHKPDLFTDRTFVEHGLLEHECAALMKDFFEQKRITGKLK